MRRYAVAGVVGLAVVLAGCGGGASVSTPPNSPTVTATTGTTVGQTPSAAAKLATTPGRYASGYPVAFGRAFDARCRKDGNGSAYCGCVVRYLKHYVPFASVLAEAQKLAGANPPSWFVRAENYCFTP